MKFSIFNNVKSQKGEECTYPKFVEVGASSFIKDLCRKIADEPDHDKRSELKKQLPIITFNSYFEGARKNDLAQPSGLFMYDGDGIENPGEFYCKNVAPRRAELGIIYAGMTPSRHGLRLVAKCRPEFTTIAECQKWLGEQIGWECDPACKDWARASYVVPEEYIYFLDSKAMFKDEAEVQYVITAEMRSDATAAPGFAVGRSAAEHSAGNASFKGLQLSDIALEWFRRNGGEPVEGERNSKLYKLALQLRHITDYNEQTLLEVMPSYGLAESEMRSLIHSACIAQRTAMPKDLEALIEDMLSDEVSSADEEEFLSTLNSPLSTLNSALPPLPPLFRQFAKITPDDFLPAVVLCMLPLTGALASKLRARYLDNQLHSPSFMVSLEAPQASGKSFMTRLAKRILKPITDRDKEERAREQEYNDKIAELKVTGVKVTAKNKKEILGTQPKGIIRYVPATISITKMLMRMENAKGLHLIAVCEEIDTVTKAFKRGFSSYSDALRVSFDNDLYGQDYASENSFSGIVPLYYNTLFSGTPKAMRRFYPDVEDGLVSRVCFVTLPDQFGKPMPEWGELSEKDDAEVEELIKQLDSVSLDGDMVRDNHEMNLEFLNRAMDRWLTAQQQEAVRTDDRTRDTFCRRAAVVGFRAGMIAWYLYGEKNTPNYRKNTIMFAQWVANQMLVQHLLRFQVDNSNSNTNRWTAVFNMLGDEFSRADLQKALLENDCTTAIKQVIYNWHLLGIIEVIEEGRGQSGHKQALRFKKL